MKKSVMILSVMVTLTCILLVPSIVYAGTYFAGTGHYYERILIPGNITWHQCRDSAISAGGYLATATSQEENDFLANLANPYATFLGGTDEAVEGQWHWITGEPWLFTAWRSGEPNNAWNDEDYIGLDPVDRQWNDMRNWFIDPQCFIIEFNSGPPPDSNIPGIIRIPADQPTIQAGIDSAVSGDTVLVAPGVYVENLDFRGKKVLVKSENGPESTTIMALDESKAVISFVTNEPKGAGICGFTITAGGNSGIYSHGSAPCIENNIRQLYI